MRPGILIFLFSASSLFAQVVPGRYIVELAGDPAARAVSARDPRFASRRAAVRLAQASARRNIGSLGGMVLESLDTVLNAVIVNVPEARAAELAQIPGVVAVHPVRRVAADLDHALPLHKVPDAWAALPLGRNSAGAGIKIGIIDTGIDVNNPVFSDPLPALDGFPKVLASGDLQFTNAKVIVAKNYTRLLPDGGDPDANDHVGHGTGTATAAAGGPAITAYGPVVGVAPKAYIGNYKALGAAGGTTDTIAKAIDDAVADGMDVLNLSLGGYVDSYADIDDRNPMIAAVEAATAAGVIVAVSAGNSGPAASTLGDLGQAPDVITAGAIRNDRFLSFSVAVDGVAPYAGLAGNGVNPSRALSAGLLDVATLDPDGLACSALPPGSAAGMVVLVLRGTCTFEDKINHVAAGGALAAVIYNSATGTPFTTGGQAVGSATLPVLFMNRQDGLDLLARVSAAPGLPVTVDFAGATGFAQQPGLTSFSSRGPSLGHALKPDLVAVGQDLVTAGQNSFPDGAIYSPSGFVIEQGTSYSAPLTAGAAALLKSARPGLTVAQYRSLLINSATPAIVAIDAPTTISQAGAGSLNVAAALNGTIAVYPTALNFGQVPGSIHGRLTLTVSNVATGADTYTVSVSPAGDGVAPVASVDTFSLDLNGAQAIVLSLDATGLAPGEYQGYVQLTGTAFPTVTRVPYWFAVPGAAPTGISIIHVATRVAPRTTAAQAIVFRVVDTAGLPFVGTLSPKATITGGDGTVRTPARVGSVPGTYGVDVLTGSSSMQVSISVGDLVSTVVVPVR